MQVSERFGIIKHTGVLMSPIPVAGQAIDFVAD